MNLDNLHIHIMNKRIGVGIGDHNTVIRAYHIPSRILIEIPCGSGGQHHERQLVIEMIECALASGLFETGYGE